MIGNMGKDSKLSIVIPNFNGRYLLERNLPAVIEAISYLPRATSQIIVVDDASTDGSVAFLKKNFPEVRVIVKKKNEGFSSTVNLGVKKARGELVVLLNTDVKPEVDFLPPLIPHFSDSKVFAVGMLDKSVEKGKIVLRGRGVGDFKRGFLIHSRGGIKGKYTLWASGGSSVFKRKIWLKLGGLDRIYDPFYGEDLDLGYRAWKAGYKILFEPKSKVFHFHEEGVIKKGFSEFYKRSIAFRNQVVFVLKNITDPKMLLSFSLFFPYHLLNTALKLDFAFWVGSLMVIPKISQALKARRKVKKLFVLSDKEVFANFR